MKSIATAVALSCALIGITGSVSYSLPQNTVLIDSGLQEISAEYGKISWSIDGAAEIGHVAGNEINIQVAKPANAVVRVAYFISGDGGNRNYTNPLVVPQDVYLNDQRVIYSHHSYITTSPGGDAYNNFNTYYGDVTSLVKSRIDSAPAGTINIPFDQGDGLDGGDGSTGNSVEGGNLIVIFDDPSAPLSSIYLNAGSTDPVGSTTTLSFPALTAAQLNNQIEFSLGISNSWQMNPFTFDGESSGHSQASRVSVNGTTISNSAGGCDDSESAFVAEGCNFGGYNTIGGVGDSNNLPPLNASIPLDLHEDDELYNLTSLMSVGDTSLTISTVNDSMNDNVFFSGIYLKGILPTSNYCSVNSASCYPNGNDEGNGNSSSPVKRTKQVVIYFDSMSSKLDRTDIAKLKKFAKLLPKNADISINVLGYVQPTRFTYNDKSLSKRRAVNVKNQLADFGLSGVYVTKANGKSELKGWKGRRVVVTATYFTQ